MILYNNNFEKLVESVVKIHRLGIDIAIYMENVNKSINLYIANNLSHATYSIKHAIITNTTWRIIDGKSVIQHLNSEIYKVDAERVKELYGVDDDEIESDYTPEELEQKALLRTTKVVTDVLEERVIERLESEGFKEERLYNIFWQSEMIGMFLPNTDDCESDYIKMLQSDLDNDRN